MFLPAEFHGVPVTCIERASSTYGVPFPDIVALMKNEGGRPGTAVRDSNGTSDLGPLQVNSCHLPLLEKYGYRYQTLRYNACANTMAGVWVFARCLAKTGSLLSAAACYNAGVKDMPAAWHNGYVQRFARHLGIVIGAPENGTARSVDGEWMEASLVIER
ncbi:lytic transglycosylase domain-containing protein [Acidithiobacillus ferrooxidans]|uniref:lytic transglycosylase domain-containing protein n=1 Tax=Acidithiobacillus ferrooxidans TaxID=920 RepID=UPI001C07A37D|nr:lytic transglycosylase domain-containing protein [Acidithiobacillus ferrooxidans]MBU2774251.1 lytic transglycosylase domain-containing protein [Acidithiobacillus ferrooxidans]